MWHMLSWLSYMYCMHSFNQYQYIHQIKHEMFPISPRPHVSICTFRFYRYISLIRNNILPPSLHNVLSKYCKIYSCSSFQYFCMFLFLVQFSKIFGKCTVSPNFANSYCTWKVIYITVNWKIGNCWTKTEGYNVWRQDTSGRWLS